MQAANSWR